MNRICTKCQLSEPDVSFYTSSAHSWCKTCIRDAGRERYKNSDNAAVTKARSAAWRLANPERNRELKKRWHEKRRADPEYQTRRREAGDRFSELHPDRRKVTFFNNNLRRSCERYGITVERYAEMLTEQGNVCAACGLAERAKFKNGTVKRLAIDHDHVTNKVRGLLCTSCNLMLGHMRDNADRLLKLADYLRSYNGTTSNATANNEAGETFPLTPASLASAYFDVLTRGRPELLN